MKKFKIAVAGTGYVGLSLSVLLAQHNQVMAVDIVQAKVDMINNHTMRDGSQRKRHGAFSGKTGTIRISGYDAGKNLKEQMDTTVINTGWWKP